MGTLADVDSELADAYLPKGIALLRRYLNV